MTSTKWRTTWLWHVCCEMPRTENTQGVLYSDPGQRVLYAFFTRFFKRVFYLAQNRGLRRKQVVRCGPPQPPGCGAGLEVWQFSVACVPRATRHGRAIPEHTAPAESAHARFLFVCSVARCPPPAIRAMACVYSNCCVTAILP